MVVLSDGRKVWGYVYSNVTDRRADRHRTTAGHARRKQSFVGCLHGKIISMREVSANVSQWRHPGCSGGVSKINITSVATNQHHAVWHVDVSAIAQCVADLFIQSKLSTWHLRFRGNRSASSTKPHYDKTVITRSSAVADRPRVPRSLDISLSHPGSLKNNGTIQ